VGLLGGNRIDLLVEEEMLQGWHLFRRTKELGLATIAQMIKFNLVLR
jgi:hypothetical protein